MNCKVEERVIDNTAYRGVRGQLGGTHSDGIKKLNVIHMYMRVYICTHPNA